MKSWLIGAAVLGAAAIAAPAQAAYVINVLEVGSDVIANGSGSLNMTDLTFKTDFNDNPFIDPAEATLNIGPSANVQLWNGASGPTSFGPGTGHVNTPDTSAGDFVQIDGKDGIIEVPLAYVSGAPLTSTETWLGASFASLGATPGTYKWTWGTGRDADSLTVNIGRGQSGPVPEPASWALMIGAMMGLGAALRRRRSVLAV